MVNKSGKREGFSLVEMIIVVAVMGILIGGVALSYNLVRSVDTKGAAYDINNSLTDLKSKNMAGNKAVYMHLYRHNAAYYIAYSENETFTATDEAKKIGNSSLKITCKDATGTTSDLSMVHIGIQKKDGAFLCGPSEITISANHAPTYKVQLIQDTGKHYVEK